MNEQEQENRLRKFAGFFKSYMGVMPLVTAAVAPILTLSKAIPVFESEKTTLATYSGLLGFLMVAWVFYARSSLVAGMVPYEEKNTFESSEEVREETVRRSWFYKRQKQANFQPLLLIILSVISYMSYTCMMDYVLNHFNEGAVSGKGITRAVILATAGVDFSIPYHAVLQILYLGIFLFAEAAFVLMALREYAYGVLKIPEVDVLGGAKSTGASLAIHMELMSHGVPISNQDRRSRPACAIHNGMLGKLSASLRSPPAIQASVGHAQPAGTKPPQCGPPGMSRGQRCKVGTRLNSGMPSRQLTDCPSEGNKKAARCGQILVTGVASQWNHFSQN